MHQPSKPGTGVRFPPPAPKTYVNGSSFLVDGGLTAAYVTPE